MRLAASRKISSPDLQLIALSAAGPSDSLDERSRFLVECTVRGEIHRFYWGFALASTARPGLLSLTSW